MRLIDALLSGNLDDARELFASRINEIFEEKLEILRLRIVAEDYDNDGLSEAIRNIQKVGRTKIVRIRVRNGKVQRRKRFSTVKGYTIRGGRLVRMSPREVMNRKRGARRAKIKVRTKRSQILRKRKISLRKRRAMGVR